MTIPTADPAPPAASAAADTVPAAEVLPLVERVDAEDAALLRGNPSSFAFEPLPFYRAGAGLLRATALLPQRPVEFRYVYARGAAAHDRRLMPLGTPERVAAANAASGLQLTPATALAYLEYYVGSAGGGGWAGRRLLPDVSAVPWLPDTERDPAARAARAQASARIHAARVEPALGGGVRVTINALRGRTLEAVTYAIARDGAVSEERATTLMPDVPVVEVL